MTSVPAFSRISRRILLSVLAALPAIFVLALLAAPADAQAPGAWTQVGVLTCRLNPSIGFIFAGHQSMECNYAPAAGVRRNLTKERSIALVSMSVSPRAACSPGPCSHPLRVLPLVRFPANMSAPVATSALASVWVPTFCSEARAAPSHYSRFRLKAPSPSTSR